MGARRRNDTHPSPTDPLARMFRKNSAHPASPCYARPGQVLMEDRNGRMVEGMLIGANGSAEREASAEMVAGSASPSRSVEGQMKNHLSRCSPACWKRP